MPKKPDYYEALHPHFAWLPKDRVKATVENSTQWFKAEGHHPMCHHFKTRFPAANVAHLNEDAATDTFMADTPALDDGIPGHKGTGMVQTFT